MLRRRFDKGVDGLEDARDRLFRAAWEDDVTDKKPDEFGQPLSDALELGDDFLVPPLDSEALALQPNPEPRGRDSHGAGRKGER